jgi:CubicO group peptidase (beta-lactamase class C family)
MLSGEWSREFAPVVEALRDIRSTLGGGAAAAVYHHGRPVVDVWCGDADEVGNEWREDTLAVAFSTTKGITATAVHWCVDRGLLAYDQPVVDIWPEFAANGKESITVRHVLCHEAGLYALTDFASRPEDIADWEFMVEGLARMRPAHPPGDASAYHAVTFGHLAGELVVRATKTPFTEFVTAELAAPLGLDGCFVGLPPDEVGRVATPTIPPSARSARDPANLVDVAAAFGFRIDPDVVASAFPGFVLELPFPDGLREPIPAANGCFTARSLARLYALLAAGGTLDGTTLLAPETVARAAKLQSSRPDLVLGFPILWRLGYQSVVTLTGPVEGAFGHNGFGGSGAWADPGRELSLAFLLNHLRDADPLNAPMLRLGEITRACADAAG